MAIAKSKRINPPRFGLVMEIPSPFFNESRLKRIHKDSVKESLKETLFDYWRTGFKAHFKQTARANYRHAERARIYKAQKKIKTRSITDILYTGKTKSKFTTQRPAFSMATGNVAGQARQMAGKGIHGTNAPFGMTGVLTMSFPFPASTKQKPRQDGKPAVTPAVMASELARWSADASVQAMYKFRDEYARKMFVAIANAPRWRRKYAKNLHQLYS